MTDPWKSLKDEPYAGERCVLLFPIISDVGIPFNASNPEYAKTNALKQGYTHYMEIPKLPGNLEAEAESECKNVSDSLSRDDGEALEFLNSEDWRLLLGDTSNQPYPLPEWEECKQAVKTGKPTALQDFIYHNEPSGKELSKKFRIELSNLVMEITRAK